MGTDLVVYEPSDFEYVMSALASAENEGLTLKDLSAIVRYAKNGEQFDMAVSATIRLKELVE